MRMVSKWVCVVVCVMVVWAFGSCNRSTAYYHYEHTPLDGWDKNDTVYFQVASLDAGNYREELGLRIDDKYPFQALTLVVTHNILPSGYTLTDTVNCSLADKRGRMKGTGISRYQYNFHINTLNFREGDSLCVISVRHNMKREVMPGITDVGIRLDRQ